MECEFETKAPPTEDPQAMQKLLIFQKTKIADIIYMKYDVKAVDLIRAA